MVVPFAAADALDAVLPLPGAGGQGGRAGGAAAIASAAGIGGSDRSVRFEGMRCDGAALRVRGMAERELLLGCVLVGAVGSPCGG